MNSEFQKKIKNISFEIAYFLYILSLLIGLTMFKDIHSVSLFQELLRNLSYIFLVLKICIDFYDLQNNPARVVGNMGKEKGKRLFA